MFFISALFPRPFSASASRILDLDERLVIIRMSARGLFIFLFAEFSDVSYLYLPCVVPRSRKHLSVLLLRTDAYVPPPLCIPFNKNSADAAEIILRFEMKNDGECKKLEKNAAS